MRKADYALLAEILRKKQIEAKSACNGMDAKQDLIAMHIAQCAWDIAYDFARSASVDRMQFLKSSGLIE